MEIEKSIDYRNKKSLHLFTISGELNPYTVEGIYEFFSDFKIPTKRKIYTIEPVFLPDDKKYNSVYIFYDSKINEEILKQAIYEHMFRKLGSYSYIIGQSNVSHQ